jgi:hypothetical protein
MKSTFREYTTISGMTIFVRPNYSKRIFTIKGDYGTFKTYKLSENEFNYNLFNTGNDWKNYLINSTDVFSIKL